MRRFLRKVLLFFLLFAAVCISICCFLKDPDNYMLEYDVKMGMLDNPNRRPALILLGGSGSAFGFISPMIEDSLGIPVINVAIHAGLGQNIIVNDCFPHLREDDIVIYSPEYSTFAGNVGGGYSVDDVLLLSDKFDVSIMTIANWKAALDNLPLTLKKILNSSISSAKQKLLGKKSQNIYARSSFNSHGDVVAHWNNEDVHYNGSQAAPIKDAVNVDFIHGIIGTLDKIGKNRVILYPAPLARKSFELQKPKIYEIADIFSEAGHPFICDPMEESYPDSTHYDTEYHLRRYAAEMHTKHLIELLKQRGLCSLTR